MTVPAFLRVTVDGRQVIYRVTRVVDVRPSTPDNDAPTGWLIATLEGESDDLDETTAVTVVVPPASDDPTAPDWTRLAGGGPP